MNDRIKVLQEFLELNYRHLDKNEMKQLYLRIFDFEDRCYFSAPIDIYVDIKHFMEKGVKRIKEGHDTWYKDDFTKAGLLETDINSILN